MKDFIRKMIGRLVYNSWSVGSKEVIYNSHTIHWSHLKVNLTYEKVLKAEYWWEDMLKNIKDFYFKCQVCEIRASKPRKNAVIKHIDSFKHKDRYQEDVV